ncbi:MAG: histidine kinase [Ferruginibacter sp.]
MKREKYKKWLPVLVHVAAWVLLFSLPYLLRQPHDNPQPGPKQDNATANFITARITDLLLIGFFYLNAEWLLTRIFYRKKYFLYVLSVLACFFAFSTLTFFIVKKLVYPGGDFTFVAHLRFCVFVFVFILACSIAYKTVKNQVIADNLYKEIINENLKTELALLRSQVSPHFMFNVLNNMVALARKQSDQLEPSLIQLSSLMRYMLYETGEQKVSLEKETEYLQSYITLQQQRFGKKLLVHFDAPPADRQYEIEPMLLIPFVENAFKHGTGIIEHPEINISLEAKDNLLHFVVSNKYDSNQHDVKDDASGIGLANVQRRLELLYQKKQQLHISRDNNTFNVSLQINLT